jgi:O-methyltransferase involved in polyketide biosynthesis
MDKFPQGIDPNVPSPARIYDYLLGGKDNFAVDRAAAEKILEHAPNAKEAAQANRRFLIRAVEYLADQGIRQFLDIGAGLPTQENVHEVALRKAPDSRIVYVDNDPIVLAHARALLACNAQTIAVAGDLREPESILDNPEVTAHLDFNEPVGLILVAILHFIPDEAAYPAVAKLRDRLAPGSHLVISHGSAGRLDDKGVAAIRRVYARSSAGEAVARTREEILRFFEGASSSSPAW